MVSVTPDEVRDILHMQPMTDSPDFVEEFLGHDYGFESTDAKSSDVASAYTPTWYDVGDRAISAINVINCDPTFKGNDLNGNAQVQKQYDALVAKRFNDRLVSMGILPMNKIDENAFVYSFDRKAQRLRPMQVIVAHGSTMSACPDFLVNLDSNGFVVGIKPVEPKDTSGPMWKNSSESSEYGVSHSVVGDVLAHYGVLGMHWGVRTKRPPKQGPSKDAKRVSLAQRKAKKSGISSLTNQELKDLTQRLELERKFYNRQGLPKTPVQKGQKYTKELLAAAGITSAASLATWTNSKKGKRFIKAVKKALEQKGQHAIKPKPPSTTKLHLVYRNGKYVYERH